MAVKDARADLWLASQLMEATGLDWYSGDDAMNLAHFGNGAVGFVGVTSQVAPAVYRQQADAVVDGRWDDARAVHRRLAPLVDAVMNVTQGAIMAKAALALQGLIESPVVRLPLVPADDAQSEPWDVVAPWAEGVPADEYADAGATWLVVSAWPSEEDWVEGLRKVISSTL